MFHPRSGVTQATTLTHWGHIYSLLEDELATVLGIMTYTIQKNLQAERLQFMEYSLYAEGKQGLPADTGCTDGSTMT